MTVDRRTQILRVGASMFARQGFHGVSMDELGAAVGLTGPALYRYFPSKEAILSALLVDISDRLLDGGRERGTLDELIDFHVDFALDEPDLIDVQSRDLDSMPPDARREVRRLQSRYVGLWVDAVRRERPGLDEGSARAAALAVFGLINSTPHSARLGRDAMHALLADMARAALAAASGGP